MKIDHTVLLIKIHYFFFFGIIGPILPYIHVFEKQLGISPSVTGTISAILPIMYLILKPIMGFIMDYFETRRRIIFLLILAVIIINFGLIFLIPELMTTHHFQNVSCTSLPYCDAEYRTSTLHNDIENTTCYWICKDTNFSVRLFVYVNQNITDISSNITCLSNINKTLLCPENNINFKYDVICDNFNDICDNIDDDQYLYTSAKFWIFVIMLCFGKTAYYIMTSVNDTICFNTLGKDKRLRYGKQRLWGTISYGITAFLSGYLIDLWSQNRIYKIYTPAAILIAIFGCIDFICCIKLKLPFELKSTTILKDTFILLTSKSIIIYLFFVTCFGILNSFIRNFWFWYIEDLAIETNYVENIKVIEGLIVATETFAGELVFLFFSGKILEKLGHDYTFILCFICFMLRLILISLMSTPWWALPIGFLHGPTCALSLATIVGYASIVAPPGTAATIQGLVQSLSDGLGFSIGSLIGGFLYKTFGGIVTLRVFSAFAACCAILYFILYIFCLKGKTTDTRNNIKWQKPDDARKHCVVANT